MTTTQQCFAIRRFDMILISSKLCKSALKSFLLIVVLSICFNLSFGFVRQDDRYAEEIKMIEDCVKKEMERLKISPIFRGSDGLSPSGISWAI